MSAIELRLFDMRFRRDRSFLRFQSKHSIFRFIIENVCTWYHVALSIFIILHSRFNEKRDISENNVFRKISS